MKITNLILGALFTVSSIAQAGELPVPSRCQTKQENAAMFEIAQAIPTNLSAVNLLAYIPGMWTEAVGNNSGFDIVEVRAPNWRTRDIVIKRYIVSAKQIGTSDDCEILGVDEDVPFTHQ